MFAIRFYRMYDIGKEVDLKKLDAGLAMAYTPERAGFTRVNPKSILMQTPPLSFHLPPVNLGCDGRDYSLQATARVYDIGAISFCMVYEDPGADISALEDIAVLFAGQEGLSDLFRRYLDTLGGIVGPYIKNFAIDADFYEDYSVYLTDASCDRIDPVRLLTGGRTGISSQQRDEILKNSLSYTSSDRVVLSWDSALVCGTEPSTDLTDLVEYANVQVFELRYYDRELTRQMERMYDDIQHGKDLWWFLRTRQYHAIMATQMETSAEISEIIEKIDNLIKVTEDVYYARVYATALKVLRSGQWSESVSRKIAVIHENYSMLSDEVRIQHSNFLEWVIIVLIALEFGLAIWQSIQ
jgi:hypothetical protein